METVTNFGQNNLTGAIGATQTADAPVSRMIAERKPLFGAYVALLFFVLNYCARPKDWIPGLTYVPLAKITGILALLTLILSLRQIRGRLPREVILLGLLTAQLFLAAALSSVWRGGALLTAFDFAKVLIIVTVMSLAVNTLRRLKALIFIQAACVAVIGAVTLWNGHHLIGRLDGIIGGSYSDPNDLALTMVISLPLSMALFFLSRNVILKVFWAISMLVMTTVVFLTGSRGGFLSLTIATAVCLWEFAIRGRKRYLLVVATIAGAILLSFASGMVLGRLRGTFDSKDDTAAAFDSAQARRLLLWHSIEVTARHPLFGVGPGNFLLVSGGWQVAHNSFTQMSSEGGLPACILFAAILWFGFKNIRATKRLGKGQREKILLARALRASTTGFIVGSLFATFSYEFFPYMLVAYSTILFSLAKASSVRLKKETSVIPPEITERNKNARPTKSEMVWNASSS